MTGKAVYVFDDSIIGFATLYLMNLEREGKINRHYITVDELNQIRENVINSLKSTTNHLIIPKTSGKECFTPKELKSGKPEQIFFYDNVRDAYYTTKPYDYLRSTYNSFTNTSAAHKFYTNEKMLSACILQSESSK